MLYQYLYREEVQPRMAIVLYNYRGASIQQGTLILFCALPMAQVLGKEPTYKPL